jgi:hypothetical protein
MMAYCIALQDIPDGDMEQLNQKQIIVSGKYNDLLILQMKRKETSSSSHSVCDLKATSARKYLTFAFVLVAGYKRWADRFPRVRNVVHQHVSV